MTNLKQEAIRALSQLPDTADAEEMMYRLYVLENVRKGQADAAAGRSVSAEELRREIETW